MTGNCCQALGEFNLGFILFIFTTTEERLSNVTHSRTVLCKARAARACGTLLGVPRAPFQPGPQGTARDWGTAGTRERPGHRCKCCQQWVPILRGRAGQEGAVPGARRSQLKPGEAAGAAALPQPRFQAASQPSNAGACQNKSLSRPECAK